MSAPESEPGGSERVYWRRLLSEDPASVSKRTLAMFDQQTETFVLSVLDKRYAVRARDQTVRHTDGSIDDVGWDVRLLTLAYLTGATEDPLTGRWVSPVGFSGGDLFFSSSAHDLEFADLLRVLKSPQEFLTVGDRIGGTREKVGDASLVLQTLPRLPILLIYWQGDEELPSKISALVDESARHHLAIDGMWLAIKVSEKRILQMATSLRGC